MASGRLNAPADKCWGDEGWGGLLGMTGTVKYRRNKLYKAWYTDKMLAPEANLGIIQSTEWQN